MSHQPTLTQLAKMIDHSLLHPTLTDQGIRDGCAVGVKYSVATVCVKPYAVSMALEAVEDTGVGVCAVVAFPHGNSTTAVKVVETERALNDGATEIDMVVNIGKVLGDDWGFVADEIGAVNRVVVDNEALLKVIFETDFLEDAHIVRLCEICGAHDVAFVKTSTGYGFVKQPDGSYAYQGATEHNVKLMRKHVPPDVEVKAAGGVRTLDDLLKFRELGVTRVGATATAAILEEAVKRGMR
jgi:deoxyribose-phosphate aldolase